MSVTIRLAKIGKKHAPAYRVVVSNTRDKRNGKALDILGFYNPLDANTKFTLEKKSYDEWVKKGAMVSMAVKKLIDGNYEYKEYNLKKAKAAADKAAATAEKTE